MPACARSVLRWVDTLPPLAALTPALQLVKVSHGLRCHLALQLIMTAHANHMSSTIASIDVCVYVCV